MQMSNLLLPYKTIWSITLIVGTLVSWPLGDVAVILSVIFKFILWINILSPSGEFTLK